MANTAHLSSRSHSQFLLLLLPALLLLQLPAEVKADCWLIEGDKGYVWLAICSQNQPPYETIPQHINSTVSTNCLSFYVASIQLYAFVYLGQR